MFAPCIIQSHTSCKQCINSCWRIWGSKRGRMLTCIQSSVPKGVHFQAVCTRGFYLEHNLHFGAVLWWNACGTHAAVSWDA